jgi:hypothetical protein
MSHSHGEIWSPEGQRLGWFEYNGNCDVVCTRVYKPEEDMYMHWRKDNLRQCQDEAGHQARWQDVVLYTSYGWGFHWPGKVCWDCQAVVDGIMPTGDFTGESITRDGHPFFDASMLADYGKILPCPACGGKLASLVAGGKRIAPIMCEECKKGFYSWELEEMCQIKKQP